MNNAPTTQETKWYYKIPIIILAGFLFFPLGLFLLWKAKNIQMGWKVAGTAIIGVYGLILSVATFMPETPEMKAQARREDSVAHVEQLKNDNIEANKKQKEIAQEKQKEVDSVNKAELSKEPRIISSIDELKKRFNDFAASLTSDFDFRINDIQIEKAGNSHIFKYAFSNNFEWIGTLNESDNSINEIAMIVSGDENYTRKENVILLGNTLVMMAGIIATADPSIKPQNRGDILRRMGIFDKNKKITNMKAQVIQNGIRYWMISSPEMGISFGADLKDLQ